MHRLHRSHCDASHSARGSLTLRAAASHSKRWRSKEVRLSTRMTIFSWLLPVWKAKVHDGQPAAVAGSSPPSSAGTSSLTASLDTQDPHTRVCFDFDAALLQRLRCIKDSISVPVCILVVAILCFLLLLACTGRFNWCLSRLRSCWPRQQAAHAGKPEGELRSCCRVGHCRHQRSHGANAAMLQVESA